MTEEGLGEYPGQSSYEINGGAFILSSGGALVGGTSNGLVGVSRSFWRR
jgi:hypothetical protein